MFSFFFPSRNGRSGRVTMCAYRSVLSVWRITVKSCLDVSLPSNWASAACTVRSGPSSMLGPAGV